MTYFVIGLMSGSSHDGLDICYNHITFISGKKWEYAIKIAETIPYPTDLRKQLSHAAQLTVPEFLKLDRLFARFCANQVNAFIQKHDLEHKVFFIASHGHTVWHEPKAFVSSQIGDGATLAALTGYTTISDLRNMDIALGGQGAPIVPIADHLLFPEYDFCLNIGGIANLTVNSDNPLAFDVCPANQLLNHFAQKQGKEYDAEGQLAAMGKRSEPVFKNINKHTYYQLAAPKSLANSFSVTEVIPSLETIPPTDALNTSVRHIAFQIAKSLKPFCKETKDYQMLITGGGAFNSFLVETLKQELSTANLPVSCLLPDENLIRFKEALAMSLIGVLRWREEENTYASVTGASRNSIGGAIWLGTN